MRSASTALIGSPVSRYSLARAGPTASGQAMVPPSPATSPTRTWGSASVADSAMRITSHSSAMLAPSPTAGPLTAAHDRQRHVEQVPDHLAGVEPQGLEGTGRLQLGEPGEVATGGEGPARSR